eukprot:366429-Chlamydomonas_euryale.AAC.7
MQYALVRHTAPEAGQLLQSGPSPPSLHTHSTSIRKKGICVAGRDALPASVCPLACTMHWGAMHHAPCATCHVSCTARHA